MPSSESKTCTKCGETKPLDEFYKQADCLQGRRPECKVCLLAKQNERREANIELHRQRDRDRYANNPQRRSAQIKTAREHYADNREHHLENRRVYYEANKERFDEWRSKREARKRAVDHQPYTRTEIFDRDGGKCCLCGLALVNEPRGFSIDHIVPIALGGPDTPANLQLTCQPCNRRKWMNLEGQIHLPV